jgi:hypothetical protein
VEFLWAIWSKITVEGQTAGHKMGPHHTEPVSVGRTTNKKESNDRAAKQQFTYDKEHYQ